MSRFINIYFIMSLAINTNILFDDSIFRSSQHNLNCDCGKCDCDCGKCDCGKCDCGDCDDCGNCDCAGDCNNCDCACDCCN